MIDKKMLDALSSAIYVSRQTLNGVAITEGDQKILASGLYSDWALGKYAIGDIYNADGQTWECYKEYDNAVFSDIVPGNPAWYTFNRPLHGKTIETARPFVPVQGSHDMYRAGEYMIFTDEKIYRCERDTSFSPTEDASAWSVEE